MSDVLTTTRSEPEWAAFAAIDWADQKNFCRLLSTGSRRSEAGELENTPEAVGAWAVDLQQRFGGQPVAVILEQSRGALVYTLQLIRLAIGYESRPFDASGQTGAHIIASLPAPAPGSAGPHAWSSPGPGR